ncbi:Aminoglycoside phosphotransferase [Macrophomina phaseolina MS6]|uniref:Aminoglycoside phosphotransferase n=1 Tax=Macrophomina phaseolina (strain MS6) TaxID=1126212 RepID=K2S4Q0_MACPH|nr:Aminoglycoside phosphotransferase [Macrophomina phaseolina MS6]
MGFLDGKIFEDPWLPDLSPAERHEIWREATRTLAKLHRVDISTIGLSGLKKPSKFYSRQVQTLHRTSAAQARVKNATSAQEVGELPHHDELVASFSDEELQPTNRKALVHGDFKLDNLVFDKSGSTSNRYSGLGDGDRRSSTVGYCQHDLAVIVVFQASARAGRAVSHGVTARSS